MAYKMPDKMVATEEIILLRLEGTWWKKKSVTDYNDVKQGMDLHVLLVSSFHIYDMINRLWSELR